MSRRHSPQRQKPVKGGREKLSPCVLREIDAAVTAEAVQHGVTKSFVIAVVLAQAFGIRKQEKY